MKRLSKKDENKLTGKQMIFVAEYAVDFDQFRAIKAAGYKGSDSVLSVMANTLMRKPHVKKAIDAVIAHQQDEAKLDRKKVLKKVGENLDCNLWDLTDENGTFYDNLRKIPRSMHAAIDGFEVKQIMLQKEMECIEMKNQLMADLNLVQKKDKEAYKRLAGFIKGVRAQMIKVKLSPRAQIQDMAMRHVGAYAPDKVDVNAKVASVDLSHLFHPPVENKIDPIEQAILDVQAKEAE